MLYEIAKTADVFLTNYLPAVRQKNKFDVEHIRAVNPNIIYARGSAYGDKGPERDGRRLRRHRVLDAQRRRACADPRGAGWRHCPKAFRRSATRSAG